MMKGMPLAKSDSDHGQAGGSPPEVDCVPCQELLRRIDEDLQQWDQERAARRRKIILGVLVVVAVLVVIAVLALVIAFWL